MCPQNSYGNAITPWVAVFGIRKQSRLIKIFLSVGPWSNRVLWDTRELTLSIPFRVDALRGDRVRVSEGSHLQAKKKGFTETIQLELDLRPLPSRTERGKNLLFIWTVAIQPMVFYDSLSWLIQCFLVLFFKKNVVVNYIHRCPLLKPPFIKQFLGKFSYIGTYPYDKCRSHIP